ncbi:MAG TPA: molybdopterin-dependent oxidoreductase [Gemmatimonadaceae bacterium]
MTDSVSRRDLMKGGAAFASAAMLGKWDWLLPTLQQGETVVPWTDIPANFNPGTALDTRALTRESFITPNDNFYLVQHYGQLNVDPSTYRLRVTGLVNKPLELTLDGLKKRQRVEEIVGFECGGSSPATLNRLTGNARWAGTPLRALLRDAGLQPHAREIVFFGADKGMETVTHGRATQQVEQHFGRSLAVEDAMRPEVMIVWEMNGAPLPPNHGAPIRLVVPGWYGVANVKWMDRIHVQDTRYVGRFMGRDYVTLNGEQVGDELIWNETSVARIRVKSMIARLTRSGQRYTALGFALAGALPLRSIEVRVDDGPWRKATLAAANTRYSWQMFSYQFADLPAGEHTIVSRATDAFGVMQPEQVALDQKRTTWENNGQFVRKFAL